MKLERAKIRMLKWHDVKFLSSCLKLGFFLLITKTFSALDTVVDFHYTIKGAVAKQPKKEGVRKTEKTVDRTPLLW